MLRRHAVNLNYLQTFLDRDYERRVRNLKVKCSHSAEGCLWVGELSTLQVSLHTSMCLSYLES